MSYKTILVHVDATAGALARARAGAQLAAAFDAHLIGLAPTGLPGAYLMPGVFGEGTLDLSAVMANQRDAAVGALSAFDAEAERHGAASRETRTLDEEDGVALCLNATYADLVIVSQRGATSVDLIERGDVAQYVVLHAGRPVLLLPADYATRPIGKRIMVAWDASAAAMRAVGDALPLLRRADSVAIVAFTGADYDEGAGPGPQPGQDLAQYLARHGVKVNVIDCAPPSSSERGAALLAQAAQLDADLLVMGGYGHSRLRELMLGGATRVVLAEMTLPVLMSH